MSLKDIEFLKEKSRKFYANALYLFEKGDYDLCAFNLEQACQLLLKYLIAKRTGDWPKTHYLEQLLRTLSEVYEIPEIYQYYLDNELFFDDLTDAYFTTRYFPKIFTKSLAEKLLKSFKNFVKFLERVLNEEFEFDI
ncbi:HEPN domain-containing protein [Thermocrinis jamiesonii]|uniref:HEPN domain-containing protein n=1 Tax=Thermocrinis jamiesonii TaxID=1302351 RepID=UPI0006902455|nr:HEPN domain-containing protein [Thermocrinis jamiesonii]